jgi:hypothetical protein
MANKSNTPNCTNCLNPYSIISCGTDGAVGENTRGEKIKGSTLNWGQQIKIGRVL